MTEARQPVSLQLPRSLIVLMGTAAGVVAIAGLKGISGLAGPVFLAVVLTIAAHPMRGWLEGHHVPAWLATAATIIAVYAFLLVFALTLLVATAEFASLLPTYKDRLSSRISDVTSWLQQLGVDDERIRSITSSFNVGKLADFVAKALESLLHVVSDLFFIVTLLLFLAVDDAWFPKRLAAAASERAPFVRALSDFARGTRRYLVVSTVFGLIVALVDVGLLWVLGIPAPLLWGLLAFTTNYIPNIGFVMGLVPVAVLGLLHGGLDLMIWVIVGYAVINVVIQSVIQPKVVGDAVGLSATLSFLSLIFWAWALGAVGALLAIPASLLVKSLLLDIDPSLRWLNPLVGDTSRAEAEPVSDGDDS